VIIVSRLGNIIGRLLALTMLALVLEFAWEMAQVPFFANLAAKPLAQHVGTCLIAAVGDVLIAAVTYAAVAAAARRLDWIFENRSWMHTVAWMALGVTFTIVFERLALAGGRWTYSGLMPTVAGVGIVPLAQWVVVPAAIVVIAPFLGRPRVP
jgi:hypothetical protein